MQAFSIPFLYFSLDFPENLKIIRKEGQGGRNVDYLVGGEEAPPNLYPWAVYMYVNKNGGTYGCGGSLLTKM